MYCQLIPFKLNGVTCLSVKYKYKNIDIDDIGLLNLDCLFLKNGPILMSSFNKKSQIKFNDIFECVNTSLKTIGSRKYINTCDKIVICNMKYINKYTSCYNCENKKIKLTDIDIRKIKHNNINLKLSYLITDSDNNSYIPMFSITSIICNYKKENISEKNKQFTIAL